MEGYISGKLHEELGWESLNLRRWSRRLVLFLKFVNNLAQEYTRQPIPHLSQYNYGLRRPAIIGRISARTKSFGGRFYPSCRSEWNKLDPELKQSPTLKIFKKKLLKLIRPLPHPVYSIHDPKGLTILTQLRVGLSKLNLHKCAYNFKVTVNPLSTMCKERIFSILLTV